MIDHLIPCQGFEKVRDQILKILSSNFVNQLNAFGNEVCKGVQFFIERVTPAQPDEADFINISLAKGEYANREPDYVDGHYQYAISIVTPGKRKGNVPGDTTAAMRNQKLIGIVRYILEHSSYRLLDFEPPFIQHTELTKFHMLRFDPEVQQDSENMIESMAVFSVRCGEFTTAEEGVLAKGNDTDVTFELTEQGYKYSVTY